MFFLRPDHSLLLLYDEINPDFIEEFERQIDEVARYYRFESLSEVVRRLHAHKRQGFAAIAFRETRKNVFLHALPFLVGRRIPFTLFADPDCVGLTRLPLRDEVKAYSRRYTSIQSDEVERLLALAEDRPEAVEDWLSDARKRVGPFPVEDQDPTSFSVTWGKILELPPELVEVGLNPSYSLERRPDRWRRDSAFVQRQTRKPLRLALSQWPLKSPEALAKVGLEGIVVRDAGRIERTTSPWSIPCWKLEHEEKTKKESHSIEGSC